MAHIPRRAGKGRQARMVSRARKVRRGRRAMTLSGLPEGGEPGEVPTRTEDGGSEWSNVVDLIPDISIAGDFQRGLIEENVYMAILTELGRVQNATPAPMPDSIVRRDDDGAAEFTHITIDEPIKTDHAATKAYVDEAKSSHADLVGALG